MKWTSCSFPSLGSEPSARAGHIAVAIDARSFWADELLIVYGGLDERKQAIGNLVVLQIDGEQWFYPEGVLRQPPPRAFHCAAVVDKQIYIFGGHFYALDKKVLKKFNDIWVLDVVSTQPAQVQKFMLV